jgi:hypothetical protein
MDGAWPTDYDGLKGQVIGEGGKVFELEIGISKSELDFQKKVHGAGLIFVLKLANICDKFKPGFDLHALFEQERFPKDLNSLLRNSWGSHREFIRITEKEKEAVHSVYSVYFSYLAVKGFKTPDKILLKYCAGDDVYFVRSLSSK